MIWRTLSRFLGNWQNLLGLAIVGLFIVVAIAAPLLAPPEEGPGGVPSMFKRVGRVTDWIPHPPSSEVLLGTLPKQLDIYYTLVWGTRHALRFGLTVSACTTVLGIVVGAISGYFGGAFNRLTLRIVDAFLVVPVIAGAAIFRQLTLLAEPTFGTEQTVRSILSLLGGNYVLLGLVVFSWMPHARIINASVLRLRNVEYVLAAQAVGVRNMRIVFRHLLPNVVAPNIVLAARDVGAMVLWEAAFTFIGVGTLSPWGTLAADGRHYVIGLGGSLLETWWVWVPVTLVLVLFGVGWNLLGDGLNDLLNPRRHQT